MSIISSKLGFKALLTGAAVAAAGVLGGFAAAGQYGERGSGVDVGLEAPDFTLSDLEGKEHSLKDMLEDSDTKAVVIEWFNPECPFVAVHYKEDHMTMNKTAKEFKDDGVKWVRINSGAEGKQGAGLVKNRKYAEDYKIKEPILLDMTGTVGKAYGAKVTPEIFIVNSDGIVVYHGSMDDARSTRRVGETNYVANALREVLAGESVSQPKTEPKGCSVKYAN